MRWHLFLYPSPPILAQSTEPDDPDLLVVIGSRLNQTEAEIGSSVSIITADDIDLMGYDFALDAIASAPGVTINQNGSFGGTATVRIRGAASEQTLVLIDGVPVNDPTSPGGGYNFARLDTESIERIEILKGPQSTLWGTDAIGGVVSIITKTPDEGLSGSAFAEYGSFNTLRGGAAIENGARVGDFRLAVTGMTSDGISKADEANGNTEEDNFESLTLSGKGGLNLPNDYRLTADVLWTDAISDFDSFSALAQGSVADGDERSETEELSTNVTLKGPLFAGRLQNLFLAGYTDIQRENFTNGISSFNADGDRTLLRYQGNLEINQRNAAAFGAEHEETSSGNNSTTITGVFGLYEFKPIDALILTGGVRVDDHETFGNETTGRIAVAYNPNDSLTLRASWGQGFKAPTLFQTTFFCCDATAPNVNLAPESSEAFDVGIDWRAPSGKAEAGVTYFHQDTEDQINFSFALGGYENIEEVESDGIELYGLYTFTDWLSIAADYAYIEAKDGTGATLIRVPKHTGDVTLTVQPTSSLSGSIVVRHNGSERNLDNTTLDGWTRIDLAGSYDLNEQIELFARVENLLDKDYQQVLGYGTPGLSGSFGIRARY